MNKSQRELFANAAIHIATAAVVALVFGEFISNDPIRSPVLFLGVGVALVFYEVAYLLLDIEV
jgi:hypothetical protein